MAFANTYRLPFKLEYFDEGHNFWGIERFGVDKRNPDDTRMVRLEKRRSLENDKRQLCMELKGYDPDDREEE